MLLKPKKYIVTKIMNQKHSFYKHEPIFYSEGLNMIIKIFLC